MESTAQNKEFIYNQGLANLRLEGLTLSRQQEEIASLYHAGRIDHQTLIQKALEQANG